VSKKLLALNIALAGLAIFLGAWLVRDLAASRPLPPPPPPRKPAAAATTEEPAADSTAQDRLTAYNVIVTKYLFNPSRAEGGAAEVAKPAVPLPPKPLLLGVVVDGKASRAYLEDPSTKRVFGYQVGDSVAGGKLDKITDDRIQISRSDGQMEVMLRDPTKPRPPAPAAATPAHAPGQPAAQPGVVQPQPGVVQQPTDPSQGAPPARGRPPIPPRSLRRVPVEQQSSSD
jgi:hypothetical protein